MKYLVLLGVLAFLFVTILVLSGLMSTSLNGIYSAAVYQYAVNGTTNGFFDAGMVQNAFVQK